MRCSRRALFGQTFVDRDLPPGGRRDEFRGRWLWVAAAVLRALAAKCQLDVLLPQLLLQADANLHGLQTSLRDGVPIRSKTPVLLQPVQKNVLGLLPLGLQRRGAGLFASAGGISEEFSRGDPGKCFSSPRQSAPHSRIA